MRIELNKAEHAILNSLFTQLSQEFGITEDDVQYFFFQSLVDRDGNLYNDLLTAINDRIIKKA